MSEGGSREITMRWWFVCVRNSWKERKTEIRKSPLKDCVRRGREGDVCLSVCLSKGERESNRQSERMSHVYVSCTTKKRETGRKKIKQACE